MNVRHLAARVAVDPGHRVQDQASIRGPSTSPSGESFADALDRLKRGGETAGYKVSAHAQQRIEQRGIRMDGTDQHALNEAIDRLDQKGAQQALLMRDDAAFIVNVPNRTLVTAMAQDELSSRVFTQIDSAALV
ncbi:MAG: TIGR02530 family flagellar biosynthesis protein [Rhodothermales bacterium]